MLRFILDSAVTSRLTRRGSIPSYPWGITVVNLSGSLAIGVLAGAFAPAHPLLGLLGVGLLGGYTTFSTASYDTVRLLAARRVSAGLANGIGQLVAAVLLACLGMLLGSSLPR